MFHIAERHAGLLPDDANARSRAITWMFAALNTVEPAILELATARLLEGDKPWSKERLPLVEDRVVTHATRDGHGLAASAVTVTRQRAGGSWTGRVAVDSGALSRPYRPVCGPQKLRGAGTTATPTSACLCACSDRFR